jgi:hypothetical protein
MPKREFARGMHDRATDRTNVDQIRGMRGAWEIVESAAQIFPTGCILARHSS